MRRPFFSVLLPTKNRSEIVAEAIKSVLSQTFRDFEFIISDNDDSDTATAQTVAQFDDPRIRYFRTSGKLPMHDNWENALNHARGEHVLVVEDKMRLVLNALAILRELLNQYGSVVISYQVKFARGQTIPDPHFRNLKPKLRRSIETIERFCRFSHDCFISLPKGLDSCAPLEVVRRVKQSSPTGYFFSYLTPDYAASFQLLSAVGDFLDVQEALAYIPNNWMWQGKYSTGQDGFKRGHNYRRFLGSLPVTADEVLQSVPVKSEYLWINFVLYDFQKLYRRPNHDPKIDWRKYHAFCIVIVLMGRRVGGNMKVEITHIRDSLRKQSMRFKMAVGLDFLRRCVQLGLQVIKSRFHFNS